MRFVKAHGCGNDFILVEARLAPANAPAWSVSLCDRHTGIGADGLILYAPEVDGVGMRLLNADGGEAEISGNGLRCLAAWALRAGIAGARHVVHTAAGPRAVDVEVRGDAVYRIATGLGEPRLRSDEIPMALDPPLARVIDFPLAVAGKEWRVTVCSMGNPHCSILLDKLASDELVRRVGPVIERHPLFPRRTNVEFVTVAGPEELRVRFWERGVGLTKASGTGAAGAAVAAILKGRISRHVRVVCDGGVLEIDWPEGGEVRQVGEVEVLFEGDWLGAGAVCG